jgi:hypothetical protein
MIQGFFPAGGIDDKCNLRLPAAALTPETSIL